MNVLTHLFALLGPRPMEGPPKTPPERAYTAVAGFVAALVFGALWGLAAGSGGGRLAAGNLLSVPVLLAVSSAVALPIGILVLRLTSERASVVDLVLSHASALFSGTLVLVLLAPLVLLYQLSSSWAGPYVAIGSALVAVAVGLFLFSRALRKLSAGAGMSSLALPVVMLAVVQVAGLSQLASIVPPIFHERTAFGRGVDGIARHGAEPAPEPSEESR